MTIDEIISRKEDQTFDCKSIDRICNELESRGATIPSFHTDAFILKAILRAEFVEDSRAAGETNVAVNVPLNVAVNIEDKLSERQRVILEIISGKSAVENENVSLNVPLNTKALAERLGLSRKTMQRELDWLQKHGAIRRVGAKKNGHWEIVKGNSNNN